MSLNSEINRGVRWSIASSLLMIIAGVLAILVPRASGIAVTILLGWLLMLSGVVHLAYSWHARQLGGLILGLLLCIVSIVAGGYVLGHPAVGLKSLTIVVAAYFFVEAIIELVLSFQLRPLYGSGWLLVDGIITLFLAIMIWRTLPSSTPWFVGTLVGIDMLFSGFARLNISLAARHEMSHRTDGSL